MEEKDLEATDLRLAPREIRASHSFICGWRPHRICRGYVDYHELTDEEAVRGRQENQ